MNSFKNISSYLAMLTIIMIFSISNADGQGAPPLDPAGDYGCLDAATIGYEVAYCYSCVSCSGGLPPADLVS
jgi:hypothetical protein